MRPTKILLRLKDKRSRTIKAFVNVREGGRLYPKQLHLGYFSVDGGLDNVKGMLLKALTKKWPWGSHGATEIDWADAERKLERIRVRLGTLPHPPKVSLGSPQLPKSSVPASLPPELKAPPPDPLRHALRSRDARHDSDVREAVPDPKSRHEVNGAARELLRRAVLALEGSPLPLRNIDADASLEARKALVGARWSLLGRFELNGKRYIVAREDSPGAPGQGALSARERQVLAFAKLGHHNKLIAYELGLATSTVRVLLARAAAKLGVRSRRDLLRAFDDGWDAPPGAIPK